MYGTNVYDAKIAFCTPAKNNNNSNNKQIENEQMYLNNGATLSDRAEIQFDDAEKKLSSKKFQIMFNL